MLEEPIVDAEVVEEAVQTLPSTALTIRPGSTDLIHADSPAERVAKATAMATELDAIIKKQGMRTKIGRQKVVKADGSEEWVDKYHVNVEAWQTLSTFLGVAIVPQEPEPVRADDGTVKLVEYEVAHEFYPKGTRAQDIRAGRAVPERVERANVQGTEGFTCRTLILKDGVVVGAGNSRCTRLEESWRDSPDYALEGMAQTRSQGRAMGAVARWIVALAGYSGTPAEEMPIQPEAAPEQAGPPFGEPASREVATSARKAVAWILGDIPINSETVTHLLAEIEQRAGGYLPMIAARAIGHTASAARDAQQAAAAVPGDDDPTSETAERTERAEQLAAEHMASA